MESLIKISRGQSGEAKYGQMSILNNGRFHFLLFNNIVPYLKIRWQIILDSRIIRRERRCRIRHYVKYSVGAFFGSPPNGEKLPFTVEMN